MRPSDFAVWLAALASLSAAQRRVAFREFALADADDPRDEGVEICEPGSAAGTDAKGHEERGGGGAFRAGPTRYFQRHCDGAP